MVHNLLDSARQRQMSGSAMHQKTATQSKASSRRPPLKAIDTTACPESEGVADQ